jgi:hypothetical protein
MSESAEVGVPPQEFDYPKFQQKLEEKIGDHSRFNLFVERTLNVAAEKVGVRKNESRAKVMESDGKKSILFVNESGATLDPVKAIINSPHNRPKSEENIGGEDGQTRNLNVDFEILPAGPNSDFEAGIRYAPNLTVSIPANWVDNSRPHSGIRVLHELGHAELYNENPSRIHIVHDLFIQKTVAELVIIDPKRPVGEIADTINWMIDSGGLSDLGISDKSQCEQYINRTIQEVIHLSQGSEELFSNFYQNVVFSEYQARVQNERDAWARGLKVFREAKRRGFLLDNRPTPKIFEEIDVALATRVTPQLTYGVKRLSSRAELGLPAKAEDRQQAIPMPLELNVAILRMLEKKSAETGDNIRSYLRLSDETIDKKTQRLTPIALVDSRIIKEDEGPFAVKTESQRPSVNREMESLVRLAVTAFQKREREFQEEHFRKFGDVIAPEEQKNWTFAKDMVVAGDIYLSKVLDNRYQISFVTAGNGAGYDPRKMNSNMVLFDRNSDSADREPAPIARSNPEYVFAERVKPEAGDSNGFTGWQLVGEIFQIRDAAKEYAKANNIEEDNMVRMYLEQLGYNPKTIGMIWVGYSGGHAGYLSQ